MAIFIFCGDIYYTEYKSDRSVHVEKISSTDVVSPVKESDLKVFYKNKEVESFNVSVFKVENDGQSPISSDEIKEKINIKYSKEVVLLDVKMLDQSPSNLSAVVYIVDQEVIMECSLLNPGDNFTVSVYSSDSKGSFKVGARISGVKNIEYTDSVGASDEKIQAFSFFVTAMRFTVVALLLFSALLLFFSVREILKVRIYRKSFPIDRLSALDAVQANKLAQDMFESGYTNEEASRLKSAILLYINSENINIKNESANNIKDVVYKYCASEYSVIASFFLCIFFLVFLVWK